ncbi:dihydropteroate synthase [Actimicrobium sp. CCI2.3]|uniref:dihydropteroate synthase n=1 Tax=Actimicrobium sp. CCI2.3 TaxID=3048616 RepID=UPI002AB35C71|nr:dihydropteroate synthase [Actimicrobium sp. CCI2.3]MDY7575282.1 dihydropteroate synthase [Actimicrobium sp. CCI2.3]MEB0023128.1 dihydropteroate synthase [Actimicrobium sp. CCI2.3]
MNATMFHCGRYRFSLTEGGMPLIMGVLNVTPDSFSDGGRFHSLEAAIFRAEQMIEAGVDIIDIGGESTRPGATPLPVDEELRRILPVVFALRDCGKPLSIDTYKPVVMVEALAAGADMINDISGFSDRAALTAVKDSDCALCIMHMANDPQRMQQDPTYQDVVQEVTDFLRERIACMEACGIERKRLSIDPGFGFGKTLEHNLALLKHIRPIAASLGLPLLAGMSRKSMLGSITGRPVEQRLAGSLAAALVAAANGAAMLRVHDVAETIDALKVWRAAT